LSRAGPEAVFLGLGGNMSGRLGGPEDYLRLALKGLAGLAGVSLDRVSSIYATEPVGFEAQPPFLNAAVRASVSLEPEELLERLLALEEELGRVRVRPWGPRLIDLDLLLWGERVIQTERLIIPHPEMVGRAFVLVPLTEIDPRAWHPVLERSAAELLAGLGPVRGVSRIKEAAAWSGL